MLLAIPTALRKVRRLLPKIFRRTRRVSIFKESQMPFACSSSSFLPLFSAGGRMAERADSFKIFRHAIQMLKDASAHIRIMDGMRLRKCISTLSPGKSICLSSA